MPLPAIKSRGAIGRAIKELAESGRPRQQAIAVTLDKARRSGMDIPKKKRK